MMNTHMKVKYETAGPLSSVFINSPEARVLDQAFLVGNMKQTVSMLVESTGLSFKTVQKVLQRLSGKGLVAPMGRLGTHRPTSSESRTSCTSWLRGPASITSQAEAREGSHHPLL